MTQSRICLIHGAATTARIWDDVVVALASLVPGAEIVVPDRASTGSLDGELAALTAPATGSVVVGVSGGATLGLELVARAVPVRAAVLHEPAVGSLLPGLLDEVAAAYRTGGVSGFGAALYGPSWHPGLGPADPDAVTRDLAMFRAFEPRPPIGAGPPVLITVGADSPPVRHEAAALLAARFGYSTEVLPGARHAVHLDQPREFAELIARVVRDSVG